MLRHSLLWVALASALVIAVPSVEAKRAPADGVERAWLVACPKLNPKKAKLWSQLIRKEAKARGFCPYTVISIVKNETGGSCNERIVNNRPPIEYSVGLGQVNVIHHRDCRGGNLESSGCQAYISMLMDGASNLRVVSSLITQNREFCKRKTGKPALFARWLSSYQGYNGKKGVWCNMRRDKSGQWRDVKVPRFTKRVIQYRRFLMQSSG